MEDDGTRPPRARLQLLRREEPSCGGHPLTSPAAAARAAAARGWYRRGCALEEAAPAKAIAAYRRAVALQPDHAEARLNLGRLLHETGDVTAAEAQYRRALEIAPRDPIAWFNLAVSLEDLGRAEAALDAYGHALDLDPALLDARANAARLCERLGRHREAVRHLSAARRAQRA